MKNPVWARLMTRALPKIREKPIARRAYTPPVTSVIIMIRSITALLIPGIASSPSAPRNDARGDCFGTIVPRNDRGGVKNKAGVNPAHTLSGSDCPFQFSHLKTLRLLLNWRTLYITSVKHVKGYPILPDCLIILSDLPGCISLLQVSDFSCHCKRPTFIVIASEAWQSHAPRQPCWDCFGTGMPRKDEGRGLRSFFRRVGEESRSSQ